MAPNATIDIDGNAAGRIQETEFWLDVQDLIDRCLGSRELANRVLTRFRGNLDDTLRQLDLLAERGDWAQLAKRVHRLKGEAGNVGCRPIAELASQAEEICAQGQRDLALSSLRELAESCRLFQQQVSPLSDVASLLTAGHHAAASAEFNSRN